mmetsp:Transcript_1077/g.2284  ORF Transcript_1077/g.2284 Transcript_1077/m.2284 type:complete len:81 (+) Transcript_1077:87-329(+)
MSHLRSCSTADIPLQATISDKFNHASFESLPSNHDRGEESLWPASAPAERSHGLGLGSVLYQTTTSPSTAIPDHHLEYAC